MNYNKFVLYKILKRFFQILIGILIGFLLASEFRSINYENFKSGFLNQLCSYKSYQESVAFDVKALFSNNDLTNTYLTVKNLTSQLHQNRRHLLLIGVMTAKKFLKSRAEVIYKTWGQDLKGHIIFFSSQNVK